MSHAPLNALRDPLILGEKSYHDITVDICRPIETRANKLWYVVFGLSFITMLWGIGLIAYTVGTGLGVWGLNKSVEWAWDITNFVWWIGIGHAGTLISAILLLFRQLRGNLRRHLPGIPHGPCMGRLLGITITKPIRFSLGQL
jgi:hypothetical protein